MYKLKLITWDKQEAVYSWNNLYIIGREFDSDTFHWFFPEINFIKANSNKKDYSYIIHRYKIPRHGETLQKYFENDCKKELEEKLEEELKKSINQKLLIEMLFDEILIIDKK